ncbi:DUF2867 domain-containing protein [Pseudoalteromonas sp. Ld20]|uniref:DUF2867 domain-containing protein n=1 Tax=Pseudoalteromonas sp. Ld20 TaxID=649165 RepID=UPI0038675A33
MSVDIVKTQVPDNSQISKVLHDAYFFDVYSFHSHIKNRSSLQVWLDHAATTPAWVNFLMATRNRVVGLFGLKNLGTLGGFDSSKPKSDYKVGDRVGIFTLLYLSDEEVVLGDSDKHLDVQVSIFRDEIQGNFISISTVVHVHNFLGKLYMLFVKPMHKMIVPASIKRAEPTSDS